MININTRAAAAASKKRRPSDRKRNFSFQSVLLQYIFLQEAVGTHNTTRTNRKMRGTSDRNRLERVHTERMELLLLAYLLTTTIFLYSYSFSSFRNENQQKLVKHNVKYRRNASAI